MLDLPGHPTLDKLGLIGACSRLPVRVNAERLQAEVMALPETLVGWHRRSGGCASGGAGDFSSRVCPRRG